jgi:hypothetical protein
MTEEYAMINETEDKVLAFESIMALLKETEESFCKTCGRMKKLEEQMLRLKDSAGTLIESFVAAKIWESFPGPYRFDKAFRGLQVYDGGNQTAEIDILLSNEDAVAAIKVNFRATAWDVNYHAKKRMKILSIFPPAEIKGKKLMAGIAFAQAADDVIDLMAHHGMFAIEFNGKTVSVIEPLDGNVCVDW